MGRKDIEYENVEYIPSNRSYLKDLNTGATYKEIKAWIADNYDGMKIHNKYIGEVKADCGLEKRENYNKGEGKSKDVKCLPKKEKQFLKHLNILKLYNLKKGYRKMVAFHNICFVKTIYLYLVL